MDQAMGALQSENGWEPWALPALAEKPGIEARGAMRLALLIRGAKLSTQFGDFLCIVRDVSETGVRLRLFHALPGAVPLTLVLGNGDAFAVEPVWAAGDEAGFRFAGSPIDLRRFIGEPNSLPKRALRLALTCPAAVRCHGEIYEATVRNLSRQGALIETSAPLALDQKLLLDVHGLPVLDAVVRWHDGALHGLALGQIFAFQDLALALGRLQLPADVLAKFPA